MTILVRGLGEDLTRSDISGFPAFVILGAAAAAWHFLLSHARHGFAATLIGSNMEAARYSGPNLRRTLVLIHALSGLICAVAGLLMLSRFNSVRVGHGEALLLVTVLARVLGSVDPFGGFGRVRAVVLALVILQVLSSGLNLLGANQHLSTAIWGLFPIAVMILRTLAARWSGRSKRKEACECKALASTPPCGP